MIKESEPKIREFWLKRYEPRYHDDELTGVYRVTLGDPILGTERKTFKPDIGPDTFNESGSIGFIDVIISEERIPKVGAVPFAQNPLEYPMQECEMTDVLVISAIGIEPNYRRRGFARLLKKRAEEIAAGWGLDAVVSYIANPVMKRLNVEMGYTLFDKGRCAVKRLHKQ